MQLLKSLPLALLLLLQSCGGGSTESPDLAPGEPGPYTPASIKFTIVDADRDDRTLPAILWVPLDAPTAPVLLFSHGSGGNIDMHQFTVEHLVSRGYAVALVEHTGNVGLGEFSASNTDIAVHRPLDMLALRDEVEVMNETHPDVAGKLDFERLAIGGYSYGGYTALTLCGAALDVEHLQERCTDDPEDNRCRAGLQADQLQDLVDPRLDACLLFAPSTNSWFGPDYGGMAELAVPTLLLSGDEDMFTENETHVDAFPEMPSPTWFITMAGGGHIGFTDLANDGALEHATMIEIINRSTDAFLDTYLMNQPLAKTFLDPGNPNGVGAYPEVTLKAK